MSTPNRLLLAAVCGALVVACGDGSSTTDPECGNGICEAGESAASCVADCACGNGIIDPGEDCDGAELDGASCGSEQRGSGTLACAADCTFDYSGCVTSECGDGVIGPGEDCDGRELGGNTCSSVGFGAGDLSCGSDCKFVYDSCCNDFCPAAGATRCSGNLNQTCVDGGAGCLVWESYDCEQDDDICDDSGAEAQCLCVDRCSAVGITRCSDTTTEECQVGADGCRGWVPQTDCGLTSEACAVGPQGAVCVPTASGEDCADPYPITAGVNVVAWSATNQDYLAALPSCGSSGSTGPDVVLHYTAAADGFIDVVMDKPTNNRYTMVVSDAACGTTTPELLCVSDYSPATMGGRLGVTSGTSYYIYVTDTTSGSAMLPNPFFVTVTEHSCATYEATATVSSPADGSVSTTLSPPLVVDFSDEIDTTSGTVTITGDAGTNVSLDLATAPPEVVFSGNNTRMTINAGVAFASQENITVTWSGLRDPLCQNPVTAPAWSFQVANAQCVPGQGGVVDVSQTRYPTPMGSFTEYYVVADANPVGNVYVGGTTVLYRMPKVGGGSENVAALAGVSSTHLGYDMVVADSELFTLASTTTGTTGRLWRISEDGGASWNVEDYAVFPIAPSDDFRAATYYDGRIYLVTHESTTTTNTEIWSVEAGTVMVPATATLEGSFAEHNCSGLAMDDTYYYVACGTNDRLVRVNRTTFAVDLVTDTHDLNTTKNSVHAKDLDNDGTADVLYVNSYAETVWFVCEPDAPGSFTDAHSTFGTSTISNHGLGFDDASSTLWVFDDDTREFLSIN